MKKGLLLFSLISLISILSVEGQIVTKYQQGFEQTGETYSYTTPSGTIVPETTLYSSGQRSIKLCHTTQDAYLVTDTIDLSDNPSFTAFFLEFMHINTVTPNTSSLGPSEVGIVEFKWIDTNAWVPMANEMYDVSWGGGSEEFVMTPSFSKQSYVTWQGATPNNTWWKRERFSLVNELYPRSLEKRKLQIRFRLVARNASAGATSEGWYIDKITFKASAYTMMLPLAKMEAMPDMMDYPNSRGTKIQAYVTSATAQGIEPDSVYVVYQLGMSAPVRRKTMTPVPGDAGHFYTYIPFCGYDTVVNWRMVAKDATPNHNQVTYPMDEEAWERYRSVRGKANATILGQANGDNLNLPFNNNGRFKCQFVFDSTEMAAAGFKAGAISKIQYAAASSATNSLRNRFRIQMTNVGTDYTIPATNNFYTEYQRTVYDSSLTVTQNVNTTGTINLQDTFYYSGKSVLVTFTYKCIGHDPQQLSVRGFSIPAATGLGTLSVAHSYNQTQEEYFDPFSGSLFDNGQRTQVRPRFTFTANQNLPLIHDCGISGFITPNDSTTGNAVGNNNVILTLKNYGAAAINAVRIYYTVDGGAAQYYDWTGNLAAGATTNVTVNTSQTYTVGYHEMLAWVDDTVTAAGERYRDHEPLNDTLWTRFVACDGPMSGTRYVGGSTPDFPSLSKFLYAASLCGVNGPLTVKLAAGTYAPELFPAIPGTSATNYVLFEPASGNNDVTFTWMNTDPQGASSTQYLINLQAANHIRLNNINFTSSTVSGQAVTYHVRLGISSTGCQITNCNFTESYNNVESYTFTNAFIYSGGCDSLTISGCNFNRATVAVSLVGPAADNKAHGSSIIGNSFQHQGTNGAVVRNQVNAIVDSNTFDDVYANSSYLMLFQDCEGHTRITRNTAYVTSGASCLGVTDFTGYKNAYAVIANNMLVSADNGESNMLTTPLNIITAMYTKVLNNSIKMTAPTRTGIAAATFGGGVLDSSMFYNNIVACYDTSNFAFNFIPTQGSYNTIGYNIYYTKSSILNKYDGFNCLNLAQWQTHCPADANSQCVNPAFLNSTPTDLRSYSQNVKAHAVAFAEVTDDIFGTPRDAVAPCVGAFEFTALDYDFEIIEFIEPYAEYCDAPTAAPLRVVIKNSGIYAFNPDSMSSSVHLTYARHHTAGILPPGGLSGSVVINRTIPALDTIVYNTGITIPFPTNGMEDTTYKLYAWLSSVVDYNPANDTNFTTVTSKYHFPAPDSINFSTSYGTSATVTATSGIQTWYPNVYAQGPNHKSSIYWYDSPWSTDSILRGYTFTTEPLYEDTTLYIRQKREYGLVKITEVQVKNNMPGVTYPMPLWMNSNTLFALELTNVGDYPANMLGDSLIIISNTNSLNNKIYSFPNLTIQPGQSVVLQYRNGINNVDSTKTIGTNTLNPNYNQNFAIIYRNNGTIEDAVAFNDITSQTVWANQNIPATVWSGGGIQFADSCAGVYRKNWPTSNTITPTNGFWQLADNEHRMTLGTTNKNLIRFVDNGCIGDWAPVHIHLTNLPQVDLVVEMSEQEVERLNQICGLGTDSIRVTVRNRGVQTSSPIILHYEIEDLTGQPGQAIALQTCVDTIAGLGHLQSVYHAFSQPANLAVNWSSVQFAIRVWAEKDNNDVTTFNDSVILEVTSAFTPAAPPVNAYDTISYGQRATLTTNAVCNDSLAWYDSQMNPLDTVNVYVTDYLYADDTFYVSAFGTRENLVHVGNLASTNNGNAYPSPYNPNKKYGKEQYLYTADDLIAAGHSAGPITSVSFYLDTILGNNGTFTMSSYTVSIGTTSDVTFTSNNNWKTVTQYYSVDSLTLSNSEKGWIKHDFTSPFIWDGVSSIVVQITRAIDPAITQGAKTRYTNISGVTNNRVLQKNDNNDVAEFTGNGNRSGNRPDIRFGFVDYGCEGPTTPVYVHITDIPASDAALSWPAGSDTVVFSSCGISNLDATVSNLGGQTFNTFTIDYWIDTTHGVYNGNTPLASRQSQTITVSQYHFMPGRHVIRMVVSQEGDTVHTNDTIIKTINVRFCAGTYTIGTNGDYLNFTAAIDTLNMAGVDGAVVFSAMNGSYNEQITIGTIAGISSTNTITFTSASGNPEDVTLYFAPVTDANYVLKLYGASHINFQNMTLYANGLANYSNVVHVENSSDIHFSGNIIRVQGTKNNINASCIIVGEYVNNLYLDSNVVDSGYYSVRSIVATAGASTGMYFSNNTFQNFLSQGVYLRKIDDVYIMGNRVTSGVAVNNRALTGITVAEVFGAVNIERNFVSLADGRNGGKVGIKLVSVNASNTVRSHLYNNMTACVGGGSAGLTSTGIIIDSSTYVNVYYNTAQVYAGIGSQGLATRAFSIQNSQEAHVMNNIFSNISKGYAIYVAQAANLASCNYNNYWSNSTVRLAYYAGQEDSTFEDFRNATHGFDLNSVNLQPYFISNSDLHLSIGSFCERAQYNTEVPVDIDGSIRPQIPNPTMGADEFFRMAHNIAVMDILEPALGVTDNVESDTLRVVVKLTNDGTSTEVNREWWAEVNGTTPLLTSPHRMIDEILPQQVIYDTTYIPMPIGIIDTHTVCVYFPLANDSVQANNTLCGDFFLDPAYNLKAEAIVVDSANCRRQNTHCTIRILNVGRKTFPAAWPVTVGFHAYLNSNTLTVPTLPTQWNETATLPSDIAVNASVEVNYAQTANLYPTGIATDVTVKVRAWVKHEYDQKPNNDTTAYSTVNSYYTPSAPIGTDLHIPYATWDTIVASQIDINPNNGNAFNKPIRWHRDSTQAPFHEPSQYLRSTWWETPQYFHDSTYYLSCLNTHGANGETCTSYYSQVHVYLNPRVPVDMAVLRVVEPQPEEVYMIADSVKVELINYGSQAQTNIPVHYQLFSSSHELLQDVHETCPVTIQPDQTYIFTFDSLLQIPAWSNSSKYFLRTWTDMTNENVRLNDTIRDLWAFNAILDNKYPMPEVSTPEGLDITRVSYSSLDNVVAPVGFSYLNFGNATTNGGLVLSPDELADGVRDFGGKVQMQQVGELRALHLVKGTTDTMTIECANNDRPSDYSTHGTVTVYIDLNRDGQFQYDPQYGSDDPYAYPNTEIIHFDTIYSETPISFPVTIPDYIRTGYTRMRVVLVQGGRTAAPADSNFQFGQIQDYLLYIEDQPTSVDLSVSRIESPYSHFLGGHTGDGIDDSVAITFTMTNKGKNTISSAKIVYSYLNWDFGFVADSMQWNGNLKKGESVSVTLPYFDFWTGTNDVMIAVSTLGDTNHFNDTLLHQYYKAPIIRLNPFVDNFDSINQFWYAPAGYGAFEQNYWQKGYPRKNTIMACVSDSVVWGTNLSGVMNTFNTGNYSILYTPIFNISVVRPDTLTIWLASDLLEGHVARVEFFDYLERWQKLGSANDTLWYTTDNGWSETSSSGSYVKYTYSMSQDEGDFLQRLQLRIVYKALPGTSPCDGVAFDNFSIGRAKRPVDVGIVDIIYPTQPKFGDVVNPVVILKNFGLDTIYTTNIFYDHYGAYLSKMGIYNNSNGLAPGEVDTYTCPTPFIVKTDFPDTFIICAYTRESVDIYYENDSTCKEFYLSPLDNDLGMVSFVSPLSRAIAGDSIYVTTRLRNYGQAPIASARLTYIYNDFFSVTEDINFTDVIGHPLQTFEFFNYTFKTKFRATMGMMNLKAYIDMNSDDYPFNDTISMRINGLSAIVDLAAREIVIDSSQGNKVFIQFVVDNVGARSANDFTLGYWYYNDTSTLRTYTYHSNRPLAALSTLTYTFPDTLPYHTEYYRYVTAFVNAADDNDHTNDTTSQLAPRTVDFAAVRMLVEENRTDSCRLIFQVRNLGNSTSDRQLDITAWINGQRVRMFVDDGVRSYAPGDTNYSIIFTKKVPKSPTRSYEGYVEFVTNDTDINPDNNSTSLIEVINYFDNIPVVQAENGMLLEQNYPNPWNYSTRIDFYIPISGNVKFFVMDELGRLVYQDVQFYGAGNHSVDFSRSSLSNGVYYYGIEMDGERLMRKMSFQR